ncbi:unnamed protein product, partial [Brassica oleracea]
MSPRMAIPPVQKTVSKLLPITSELIICAVIYVFSSGSSRRRVSTLEDTLHGLLEIIMNSVKVLPSDLDSVMLIGTISTIETSKNLVNGTRDSLTGPPRILRNKISSAQVFPPRVRRRGLLM